MKPPFFFRRERDRLSVSDHFCTACVTAFVSSDVRLSERSACAPLLSVYESGSDDGCSGATSTVTVWPAEMLDPARCRSAKDLGATVLEDDSAERAILEFMIPSSKSIVESDGTFTCTDIHCVSSVY
jgi:hypothetical protein